MSEAALPRIQTATLCIQAAHLCVQTAALCTQTAALCTHAAAPRIQVEPTVDGTLPDDAWLGGRADEVGRFKEAFSVPDEVEQVGSAPKRQKVEKASVPETTADWLQCWQDRLLDKQTVGVLKEFCKSKALPVGGKKDDLVRRVYAKLEEIAAEEVNAVNAEGADAVKPET